MLRTDLHRPSRDRQPADLPSQPDRRPRRTRGASPARTDPTTLASMSAARSNVDKSAGGPKSDTSSRGVPGSGSGLLAADPAQARNAPCHRPAPPPFLTVRVTADTDTAATCQPTAGDMGHTGFAARRASGVLLACVGMGTAWASGLAAADVAGGDAGHGDGPGCPVGRAGYRRQDGDGGPAVPGATGARAGLGGMAGGGPARGGEAQSPCPAARPGLLRPVRPAPGRWRRTLMPRAPAAGPRPGG